MISGSRWTNFRLKNKTIHLETAYAFLQNKPYQKVFLKHDLHVSDVMETERKVDRRIKSISLIIFLNQEEKYWYHRIYSDCISSAVAMYIRKLNRKLYHAVIKFITWAALYSVCVCVYIAVVLQFEAMLFVLSSPKLQLWQFSGSREITLLWCSSGRSLF